MGQSAVINMMQPMGSMSLSPLLGAKIGLFVLDLENPYALPQFFAHRTTWEVADIQWNPHHAHREWVASTSNQKLVLWNLSRPEAAKAPLPADVVVDNASKRRIREASSKSAVRNRALAHTQRSVQPVESASSAIERLFDAHTRAITDINWSPIHPEILASCSVDAWTYIWDLRMNGRGSGKPAQGYSAWNASMTQVKWNRVSSHRIAASCDNKVLIWDDRFGALPLASVEAHQSKIYGLQWSPDAERGRDQFMTCSLDGTIKYWDIGTEASRAASGHRRLITEPEATTATLQPVWRAKYLPFGQGAMSVAQRGDNAPNLWASGSQMQPIRRFEGHTDIVREFLFRTKGGSDLSYDDREFQLLTWSKDQTLRMWPISDELMKAVGHTPGAPIQTSSESQKQPPSTQRGIQIQEPRREVSEAWNSSPTNTSYGSSASSSRHAASDVSRSPIDRTGLIGANPSSLPSRGPASMRMRHTPPSRSPATLFRRRSTLDRGPQMRYQDQDELPEAFHDPVNWITRVRIERGDEAGDEAAPSAHLPKTKQDYGVLADEIMRVGRRFPQVFEAIDVTHRRCTALISGPWGEQEQALAYLRVTFTFPTQYPQRPPAVEVERNPSIPFKTKAELQSVLVDVVEEQSARQAPCLEACIEALVSQSSAQSTQEPEPRAAPEESVSLSAHNYGSEPGQFLQSYQDVADAVVRLTLRASDAQESELLESDVVQLMSANVLSRAKRPRFPPETITDNAM
ncbi:hypothetical protein MYAM1_002987 [Malassezia yamatoensis]|uniref:RWD domain-containing protein n=1 Tax=Malassezia yamatoensis TaxID=253288 RepID=A0AAJ5YVW2_9BASI|nr:hypothetical protein MYAM1_002987 [Malassezia yamatoensis]